MKDSTKGDSMTDYQATDRQGRAVMIKQISDNRLVFVFQDGWQERREIMSVKGDK
jgi:hypothetical protein